MIVGIVSNGRNNYLNNPIESIGLYWNIKLMEVNSIDDITLDSIYKKLSILPC